MLTPADQTQRKQALDIHKSFIVQAPAGSGKTELLTQRYLALLAQAKTPEEIIAITFTRKAAAEMRTRILEALQNVHDISDRVTTHPRQKLAKAVLARDKAMEWNLLSNPNRLRIQTIDALCAALTRQMPVLSRLGAHSKITDNAHLFYTQAAREVLTGLEMDVPWTAPLTNLLLHLDNDHAKVEGLLSSMLEKRDQWLPYVAGKTHQNNLRQILENGLHQLIRESLMKVHNSLPTELSSSLSEIISFAAQQLNKTKEASVPFLLLKADTLEFFFSIKENPLASTLSQEDILKTWLWIADLFLTQEGEWRKKLTKNQGFPPQTEAKNNEEKRLFSCIKNSAQELLERLTNYEDYRKNLDDLRVLPPNAYTDAQWEILTSLLKLLPILVAQLQLLFQEHGVVDYIEVAQSALTALGDAQTPTDLALALDYQIQHILVDEFQDTSVAQFRLLEQLTAGWQTGDGRTLFLVGDPMQSIYRFRKAEVGLFLQARENGIGSIRLIPLTLNANFRSSQTIVDWINKIFKPLMPQHIDIGIGAVPFSPSVLGMADQFQSSNETIHLHPCSDNDEKSEAQIIAHIIHHDLAKNPQTNIAILVRARSHLLEILPKLQATGIAYRAVEIETLNQRPVIQDLLALTRALLHPADRIAWLAILRAPWCGFTLSDLHMLVNNDFSAIIWEQLLSIDYEKFPSERKFILKHVVTVLQQALHHRRRLRLVNWIEGTWLALGGPACLIDKTELTDAKAFFKLLETLQQGEDIPDHFQLEQQLAQLYATPATQSDIRVDVMTIHKAKGLEFDTVILPGLDRLLPIEESQLLLCMERPNWHGNTDLLLAPIKSSVEERDPIYNYLRLEEKKRANYETIRLLYVATTRAKRSLHLMGNVTKDILAPLDIKPPSKNSLLAQLWPAIANDFINNVTMIKDHLAVNSININANSTKSSTLKRLNASWELPATAAGLKPEFNHYLRKNNNFQNKQYLWHYDTARTIGTIVHRLLCQISQDGLSHWENMTIAEHRPQIRCMLAKQGIQSNDLEMCSALIEKAIQQTLQDPRGQWILETHEDAQAEYPLTTTIDEEVKQIIIDRTFIDKNEIRWIIDYKITDYQGDALEQFLEDECHFYKPQLEHYAKIMQTFESRTIRLGLYFPLLKAWREWGFSS